MAAPPRSRHPRHSHTGVVVKQSINRHRLQARIPSPPHLSGAGINPGSSKANIRTKLGHRQSHRVTHLGRHNRGRLRLHRIHHNAHQGNSLIQTNNAGKSLGSSRENTHGCAGVNLARNPINKGRNTRTSHSLNALAVGARQFTEPGQIRAYAVYRVLN